VSDFPKDERINARALPDNEKSSFRKYEHMCEQPFIRSAHLLQSLHPFPIASMISLPDIEIIFFSVHVLWNTALPIGIFFLRCLSTASQQPLNSLSTASQQPLNSLSTASQQPLNRSAPLQHSLHPFPMTLFLPFTHP
jgi:hypothetical protein